MHQPDSNTIIVHGHTRRILPFVSSSVSYLLLSRELRTIRESSISDTISEVLSPLSSNSPLFLN